MRCGSERVKLSGRDFSPRHRARLVATQTATRIEEARRRPTCQHAPTSLAGGARLARDGGGCADASSRRARAGGRAAAVGGVTWFDGSDRIGSNLAYDQAKAGPRHNPNPATAFRITCARSLKIRGVPQVDVNPCVSSFVQI
jgi:hypothetical protein